MSRKKEKSKQRNVRLFMALLMALTMTLVFIPSMVFAEPDDGEDDAHFGVNAIAYYDDGVTLNSSQVIPGMTLKLKADVEDWEHGEQADCSYLWSCNLMPLDELEENLGRVYEFDDDGNIDKTKMQSEDPDEQAEDLAFLATLHQYETIDLATITDRTSQTATVKFKSIDEIIDDTSDNSEAEPEKAARKEALIRAVERGFAVQFSVAVTEDQETVTEEIDIDVNDEYNEICPVDESILEDLQYGMTEDFHPECYFVDKGRNRAPNGTAQIKVLAGEADSIIKEIEDEIGDENNWADAVWAKLEGAAVNQPSENDDISIALKNSENGTYSVKHKSFDEAQFTVFALYQLTDGEDTWNELDWKTYWVNEQSKTLEDYKLIFPDSADGWRLYADSRDNITINAQVCQGDIVLPDNVYDLKIERESYDQDDHQVFTPVTNGQIALNDDGAATFIVYAEAKENSGFTGTVGRWKNDEGEIENTYLDVFYNKSLAGADVTFNADKRTDISTPMFDLYTVEWGKAALAPAVKINGKALTAGEDYEFSYKEGELVEGGKWVDKDGNEITNYFLEDKENAEPFTEFPTDPGVYRCIVTGKGDYVGGYGQVGIEVQGEDLGEYDIVLPDSADDSRLYVGSRDNITINVQLRKGDSVLPENVYDLKIEKESYDQNDNQVFTPVTNGQITLNDDGEGTFIVYAEAKKGTKYYGTVGRWENDEGEIQNHYIDVFHDRSLDGADVTFNAAEETDIFTPMFDLYKVQQGSAALAPAVKINGNALTAGVDYEVSYVEGELVAGGQWFDEDGNEITNYFVRDKANAEPFTEFPTNPGIYRCIVIGTGNANAGYYSKYDRTGIEIKASGGDNPGGGGGGGAPEPEQPEQPEEPPTIEVPITEGENAVSVKAAVSEGAVVVDEIKTEDLNNVSEDANLTLDFTKVEGSDTPVTSVTLTKSTLQNIADSSAATLEVRLESGTAVIDKEALTALAAQAKGNTVQLVIDKGADATATMQVGQKEALKGMSNPLAVEVHFLSGSEKITNFNGGTMELKIDYVSDKSVRAWFLKEDGTKEAIACKHDGKVATLLMGHCSHYVIEEFEKAANEMTVKKLTTKKKPFLVKASKLKKTSMKITAKKLLKVRKANGDVTYAKVKGSKNITVKAKTGQVVVKKGLKEGLYSVKIKVKAKGTDEYLPAAKTVTCWIHVQ